jgi:hypothetical protein
MRSLPRWFLTAALAAAAPAAGCGADPTVVKLTLADAKILIVQADGVRHELAMTAAGKVTFDGVEFATLRKHGRLEVVGATSLELRKDGAILSQGQPTNIALDASDGFVENQVAVLTVDAAGAIEGDLWRELDHPKFQGEGATVTYQGPVASRRPMMFALAGFLTAASIPKPTTR